MLLRQEWVNWSTVFFYIKKYVYLSCTSVPDPWEFGTDPDPR
jgi:hypothetical protein